MSIVRDYRVGDERSQKYFSVRFDDLDLSPFGNMQPLCQIVVRGLDQVIPCCIINCSEPREHRTPIGGGAWTYRYHAMIEFVLPPCVAGRDILVVLHHPLLAPRPVASAELTIPSHPDTMKVAEDELVYEI